MEIFTQNYDDNINSKALESIYNGVPNKWDQNGDDLLRKLDVEVGPKNKVKTALHCSKRSPDTCTNVKERHKLTPEDEFIVFMNHMGYTWSDISQRLDNKCPQIIKSRFHAIIKDHQENLLESVDIVDETQLIRFIETHPFIASTGFYQYIVQRNRSIRYNLNLNLSNSHMNTQSTMTCGLVPNFPSSLGLMENASFQKYNYHSSNNQIRSAFENTPSLTPSNDVMQANKKMKTIASDNDIHHLTNSNLNSTAIGRDNNEKDIQDNGNIKVSTRSNNYPFSFGHNHHNHYYYAQQSLNPAINMNANMNMNANWMMSNPQLFPPTCAVMTHRDRDCTRERDPSVASAVKKTCNMSDNERNAMCSQLVHDAMHDDSILSTIYSCLVTLSS